MVTRQHPKLWPVVALTAVAIGAMWLWLLPGQLTSIRGAATPEDPKISDMRQQLDQLRAQLNAQSGQSQQKSSVFDVAALGEKLKKATATPANAAETP